MNTLARRLLVISKRLLHQANHRAGRNFLDVLALLALCALVAPLLLGGCTGSTTISQSVLAGDTVAAYIGMRQDATRDNTTVIITDAAGAVTTYAHGDTHIRHVINLYPDPVSGLLVGTETGQDLGVDAVNLGVYLNGSIGSNNRDWSMTSVYFDLPVSMALGEASITILVNGEHSGSTGIKVNIVGTGGVPNAFGILGSDPSGAANRMNSLQRSEHYYLQLVGQGRPWVIQAELSHGPDEAHGGTGMAYVVNPRGDRKNISWSDDGTHLQVLLSPARNVQLLKKEFGFYVAGEVTGLVVDQLKAFDQEGNEMPGFSLAMAPKITGVTPAGPYSGGEQITISGVGLCVTCTGSDPDVWVGADNTSWTSLAADSATPNSVTATLPTPLPEGVLWLGTSVGVDSVNIEVQ